MNRFVIAIPSYKRAEKQETLDYLKKIGYDTTQNVYIFVQTKEDLLAYQKNYGGDCNIVFRPADSISKARNNVLNYFNGDVDVLMMDDDISVISQGAKGEKFKELYDTERFEKMVEKMFVYTKEHFGFLFGLYPVYNEFFMSHSVSSKVTVNSVIGFPAGFRLRFDESFIAKEDIELCGRILNSGGRIIRFNDIAHKAKHRTNAGGANETWKTNANTVASWRLSVMYPNIFSMQKNKPQEVRLVAKDYKLECINLWT